MPIFRFHRGSLEDSLSTCILVKDTRDLMNIIVSQYDFMKWNFIKVEIKKYGDYFDLRIGWYTYIVIVDGYGPIGFLSENFYDNPGSITASNKNSIPPSDDQ